MSTLKTVVASLGLLGILFAFPVTSMAAGGGGASCFNVGAGGTALTGVVVSVMTNDDGSHADFQSLFQLKFKGKTEVFRASALGVDVSSEEAALCDVLASEPLRGDGVTIIDAFGLTGKVLRISDNSINGTNKDLVPGGGGNQMVISDLTIFLE